MSNKLQEGIYYNINIQPGKFFCLLLLKINHKSNANHIVSDLGKLWNMYQDLRTGKIRDLADHSVPTGNLSVLIGYGLNCFNLPGIKMTSPPDDFARHGSFLPPAKGKPILVGAGLRYDDSISYDAAIPEDIVIQAIADTQLAAYRVVTETWKLIQNELIDKMTDEPSISIVNFYTGFQREDYRSWLDFHDGLSNMESGEERLSAILCKNITQEEYSWALNATYMAFLRFSIDLAIWRKLTRSQQEIILGRDKLTGCPIKSIDNKGDPVVEDGCPVSGTKDIMHLANKKFRDTGRLLEKRLRQSHIARVRHFGNDYSEDISSSRIFRQGYEFLEKIPNPPYFLTGLNFVSFQNSPKRVTNIIIGSGWLGGTNLGGDPEKPIQRSNELIKVRAAAFYFVPPVVNNEPFPGSRIFI